MRLKDQRLKRAKCSRKLFALPWKEYILLLHCFIKFSLLWISFLNHFFFNDKLTQTQSQEATYIHSIQCIKKEGIYSFAQIRRLGDTCDKAYPIHFKFEFNMSEKRVFLLEADDRVGVGLVFDNGFCEVSRVQEDSPAFFSGIKIGDALLSINDKIILTEEDVLEKIYERPILFSFSEEQPAKKKIKVDNDRPKSPEDIVDEYITPIIELQDTPASKNLEELQIGRLDYSKQTSQPKQRIHEQESSDNNACYEFNWAASAEDFETIARIMKNDSTVTARALRMFKLNQENLYRVCYVSKKANVAEIVSACGFCLLESFSPPYRSSLYIQDFLIIAPSVGEQLFEYIQIFARDLGCSEIQVCCNSQAKEALRFFISRVSLFSSNTLNFIGKN